MQYTSDEPGHVYDEPEDITRDTQSETVPSIYRPSERGRAPARRSGQPRAAAGGTRDETQPGPPPPDQAVPDQAASHQAASETAVPAHPDPDKAPHRPPGTPPSPHPRSTTRRYSRRPATAATETTASPPEKPSAVDDTPPTSTAAGGGVPWGDRGSFEPQTIGRPGMLAKATWHLTDNPQVPDTVFDAGRLGGLEVRAASTRGPQHRWDGTLRQDAVRVAGVAGRYVIAAVADGVGSAEYSHHGADRATTACIEHLRWELRHGGIVGMDLRKAIDAADRDLSRTTGNAMQFATTLTVGVVDQSNNDRHAFSVARVGDSPAFVLTDGSFRRLFGIESAEMFDTRTDSLPSPRGQVEHCTGELRQGESLILATDGLGTPLLFAEVGEYLANAWRTPPGPIEFLQQVQFRRKSFDDDRSAVVIWAWGDAS